MNAKLLFAATVVASALAGLASTAAMAQPNEQGLTRAEVQADYARAVANGTLRKNDYDFDKFDFKGSTTTRAQVVADLGRGGPQLIGSAANRRYNPFGRELTQTSTLARADVKAEVLQAVANGTLPRTDYDFDQVQVARRAVAQPGTSLWARITKRAAGTAGS